MTTNVTQEQYKEVIKEADRVLLQLDERLSNVTVNISAKSVDVVKAVSALFGNQHIRPDGSTEITFEMFKTVADSIKKIGNLKVGDYV